MLIADYDLEVFTPPCEPGAERFSAIAHLTSDIREAMPYLNATLRGASYNPSIPALSWRKAGHYVVFHPDRIAVSNVEDRDQAIKEIDGLVKLCNRTWERRAEITPSVQVRQRPGPMALYKLLPGSNCRQCGQPTCWTFALRLVTGQQKPKDCPPLLEPAYARQLAQIEDLVADLPAFA